MKELHLASWETRFWAWLIDYIIVGLVSGVISGSTTGLWRIVFPGIKQLGDLFFSGFPWIGTSSLLLFLYWTILEGYCGQSIGKMVLNIKVTGANGEDISYEKAAVESFGKAFILIIDCLIGWIAMSGKRLRLFNRLSHTIVINVPFQHEPEGVRYVYNTAD